MIEEPVEDVPGWDLNSEKLPDGGYVALFDGAKACPDELPVKRMRWVLQHFPHGTRAFFQSQKMGRQALADVVEGKDPHDLMVAPTVLNCETLEVMDSQLAEGAQQKHIGDLIRSQLESDTELIEVLLDGARNAMKSTPTGKEIIDYSVRAANAKFLIEMEHGKARQVEQKMNFNFNTSDQSLAERVAKNPEWAEANRKIQQQIERLREANEEEND